MVNPATNKIYVASYNSSNVKVINGPNECSDRYSDDRVPASIAANVVTHKIYVAGGYFNQPERTYVITVTGTSGDLKRNTTTTPYRGTR